MRKYYILLTILSVYLFGQHSFDRIDFNNMKSEQLYIAGFSLDYSREIYIEAVGSGYENFEFDTRNIHGDPAGLYAYAWIIDSNSRKMVWRMTRDNSKRTGVADLYEFKGKISLPPGEYEVYFYGLSLKHYSSRSFWNLGKVLKDILVDNKSGNKLKTDWKLSIDGFDGSEDEASVMKNVNAIFDESIVHIRANRAFMFEKKTIKVKQKINVEVYAIGEGDQKRNFDNGWIKELNKRNRVWEMKPGKGTYAGGALKNQRYRENISLQPGSYEVAFMTDDTHHDGEWNANLPFDPLFYGITLFVDKGQKQYVEEMDTNSEDILAEITRVGDDVNERESFYLEKPSKVKIAVMGEGSDGEMNDYGWLSDSRGKNIWKANYYMTTWAGGAKKNRQASEVLTLPPGEYTIHYKTDDSHSWEGWNSPPPENAENYGIIIYFLEDVEESGYKKASKGKVFDAIVSLTEVGSDEFLNASFELDTRSKIHIKAIGEGTRGKMYDYGWIESQNTRKRVWEMDYELTVPAGGSRKNRMEDEVIELPAGKYKVYFVTDDSHAYGNWNAQKPDEPENYGIQIFLNK